MALMARSQVPFKVSIHERPPEPVEESLVGDEIPLVSQIIVNLSKHRCPTISGKDHLVFTFRILSPHRIVEEEVMPSFPDELRILFVRDPLRSNFALEEILYPFELGLCRVSFLRYRDHVSVVIDQVRVYANRRIR